jgi:hypothetical protein
MQLGDGDLTIAWARAHDAEMIEHIQALMDRGVTFHRIETKEDRQDPQEGHGRPDRLDRRDRGSSGTDHGRRDREPGPQRDRS